MVWGPATPQPGGVFRMKREVLVAGAHQGVEAYLGQVRIYTAPLLLAAGAPGSPLKFG